MWNKFKRIANEVIVWIIMLIVLGFLAFWIASILVESFFPITTK